MYEDNRGHVFLVTYSVISANRAFSLGPRPKKKNVKIIKTIK